MFLHQHFQYEHQNGFFDLSAGSINDFDFFNINSGQHQEDFDGAKVIFHHYFHTSSKKRKQILKIYKRFFSI
jgi:hypothetical protein